LARLKGFQKLTRVDEALQTWLDVLKVKKCSETTVPLDKALNRILATDLIATSDLPPFDKSAVDGYALKAEAITSATQFKPVTLQLTENKEVAAKQARQIWTGNPLPKGADAVVMLENTKKTDGKLEVWTQLAGGGNVSKKGEDVKKGEKIIKAGTRLKPHHIAMLSAMGNTHTKVIQKPRIAIIATGNELAEAGTKPAPNQIYESNGAMLSAMCQELGAEPAYLGIAKDDIAEITQKLKTALQNCDAVITSGGTSVGGFDLVPDAVNNLGKPGVIAHGMALRPAMPTAIAALNGKPVMILSGNPVAAIIGFEVFARTLICKMLGMKHTEPRPTLNAVMTRKVATALGRKTFLRVKVTQKNNEFFAEPVSARGSGAISTMTRGNGFVIVPENREGITKNEKVTVHLFGTMETTQNV
jgi:molybdopterin molybdotransferase